MNYDLTQAEWRASRDYALKCEAEAKNRADYKPCSRGNGTCPKECCAQSRPGITHNGKTHVRA